MNVPARRNALLASLSAEEQRTRAGETGRMSLTASGFRIGRRNADVMRRLIQPWQARSFSYYHQLGEIKYASQFYSRALSNLELYAAEKNADGEVVATENADAVALLERVQDPGGGRSGLLSSYGRLMFLAGEGILFVSKGDDGEEQWEMLSTDELRVLGGGIQRYKAPSLLVEDYRDPKDDDANWESLADDEARAFRIWQRDPQFSWMADCTMQGVLDLAEELVLLTQAVRARARSRLAGPGVLFIDGRIGTTPQEAAPDEDSAEDPLLADLIEAMTTAIADEGSAAAVAPIVVRVPVPENMKLQDMVHHLQIIDPTQLYPETGLRRECIDRIAIGLDMPPEILLGMATVNHWGSWQIDEQVWKSHLQPKAQQLCDDLTATFFRPTLRDLGVPDWRRYSIAYDAAKIINHPDRTKDAKELHDRIVISDEALRDAAGFDEDDAVPEDEYRRRVGVKIRDGSLAVYGEPSLKQGAELEPAPGEIEAAGQGAQTAPEVEPGPPAEPEPVAASRNGNGRGESLARILGAADLAVLRAREAAGNRLRSLAKRDPEMSEAVRGLRAGMVAPTLGPDAVQRLGVPPRELVASCRDVLADALALYGISDPDVLAKLTEAVLQHAARTLYEQRPGPLPPTLSNYVAGLTHALTPA